MGEFKVLLVAKYIDYNGEFERKALRNFGGITRGPSHYGLWTDNAGNVVADTVIPVYLATDDTAGVVRLVNEYRLNTREDCVYLRYPNGMVSLIGDRN